jgi:DNA-directed RNA polymerase subunit RPC12/RpoP
MSPFGSYTARLLLVLLGWVLIPCAPFLFTDLIPADSQWMMLLSIPFNIAIWALLTRRLLVKQKYVCPKCGAKSAFIHVDEKEDVGIVYLKCPCGHSEQSNDIAWGG